MAGIKCFECEQLKKLRLSYLDLLTLVLVLRVTLALWKKAELSLQKSGNVI